MRVTTGLVVGLLLAMGVVGCSTPNDGNKVATAGGQHTATSSANPGSNGLSAQDSALKYAQCMREHGVNMADPKVNSGGGLAMNIPSGVDPKKVDDAMQQCKQYEPNGGEPPKMDPQQLELMRNFAKCMRENGLPNFPDPNTDGGMVTQHSGAGQASGGPFGTGGVDPSDPKFKAAEQACAKYQPAGQGPSMNSSGGGQ